MELEMETQFPGKCIDRCTVELPLKVGLENGVGDYPVLIILFHSLVEYILYFPVVHTIVGLERQQIVSLENMFLF